MGISLVDKMRSDVTFDVNFWHWRALVEAVRRLGVLPEDRVSALHQPFTYAGLSQDESRRVADALARHLVPTLRDADRLLIYGQMTTDPDDGTLHRGDDAHRNYTTNFRVLEQFIAFLRQTTGFTVN